MAIGLLLGVTSLLYGLRLGATDLWAPDEPRYAAISEELRSFRHGGRGLVVLHLGDVPYSQKPPLYFWIAALFGLPFERVTEWAARAPSAIAGVASVGLTAGIGRFLLGRWRPALVGAALLATSFRFAFSARRAQLDVLLCGFELVAVALFLSLESRPDGPEAVRRRWGTIAALHASLGAAALVKGPVGWLPLAVIAAYLAWEGRAAVLRNLLPWWSWAFSIGPLALWGTAAVLLTPAGFAQDAIGDNLIGRFLSGTSHARPFYYFLIQLPLDFLPWSILLPFGIASVWQAARAEPETGTFIRRSSARFLICWVALPFLFFSLSAGKRGVYLLPIFPALALVCVHAIARAGEAGPAKRLGSSWLPDFRSLIRVAGGFALVEILLFTLALPLLEGEKSPRPIAVAAAAESASGESLGVYGMTPIEGALLYYGGPPVVSLRDIEDLTHFFQGHGELVLLRARHFRELGPTFGLIEVESFRSGDRRLSLARGFDSGTPRGPLSMLNRSAEFGPPQAPRAAIPPDIDRFPLRPALPSKEPFR